MFTIRGVAALGAAVLALSTATAFAQSASQERKEIKKYQRMTAENSPVDLWVLEGEDLWKKKRGPNNVSLERCDLGMGPGVTKGAYAHLPRYFKDTDRVQDLE